MKATEAEKIAFAFFSAHCSALLMSASRSGCCFSVLSRVHQRHDWMALTGFWPLWLWKLASPPWRPARMYPYFERVRGYGWRATLGQPRDQGGRGAAGEVFIGNPIVPINHVFPHAESECLRVRRAILQGPSPPES